MKTLWTILLLLSFAPVYASIDASTALEAGLRHAVQQAAQQQPLFSLYANDSSRKEFFNQALMTVAQQPPAGKKSFVLLTVQDAPSVRVNLVLDTAASIQRQLRANGIAALGPHEDGLTVTDSRRKDGLRVMTVFIVTDRVAPPTVGSERATAQALTTIAHEIYGHVYLALTDAHFTSLPIAKQETAAYGASATFLKGFISRPEFKQYSALLQQELRGALAREEASLKRFQAAR